MSEPQIEAYWQAFLEPLGLQPRLEMLFVCEHFKVIYH